MESRLFSSEEVEEDEEPGSLQDEIPCGLFSHGGENQLYAELSLEVRPNTVLFEIFIVNWDVTGLTHSCVSANWTN